MKLANKLILIFVVTVYCSSLAAKQNFNGGQPIQQQSQQQSGEGGGGEGDPLDISYVLPTLTVTNAPANSSWVSFKVSVPKTQLLKTGYSLYSVVLNRVTGSGNNDYTFPDLTVSTFEKEYQYLNDQQLIEMNFEVKYKDNTTNVISSIKTSGTVSETLPDRTEPPVPAFSATNIDWNNSTVANTEDNQELHITYTIPTGANRIQIEATGTGTDNSGDLTSSGTYVDSGISDNQTIQYRIRALDVSNNYSNFSAWYSKTITNKTPPTTSNTPTVDWLNSSPNTMDNQTVRVTFTKAAGVAKVQVLKQSGAGTDNSGIFTANGYYDDTNIEDSQTVSYLLRSYDSQDNYTDSQIASDDVLDRTPPAGTPVLLPAHVTHENDDTPNNSYWQMISIEYSNAVIDADYNEYMVIYGSGTGTGASNSTPIYNSEHSTSTNFWYDKEVDDEQTVTYYLRVYDPAGNYTQSASVPHVVPDRTPPTQSNKPTVVWNDQNLNSGDTQKATITFTLAPDIAKVKVMAHSGSGIHNSGDFTANGSWQDTGISDDQVIKYVLRSYDADGNYLDSDPSDPVPIADRTGPSLGTPYLLWEDQGVNTGDSQKVKIYVHLDPQDASYAEIIENTGLGTDSFTNITSGGFQIDTDVGDNQTVTYKIRAFDTEGNSTTSGILSQGILDRTAPANFTHTLTINSGTLNLTAAADDYVSTSLQWRKDNTDFGSVVNDNQVQNKSKTIDDDLSAYYALVTFTDAQNNFATFSTDTINDYTVRPMDDFTTTYYSNSNQLKHVDDAVAAGDFANDFDSHSDPSQYSYDANGNVTVDKNRGIDLITYNRLNLPVRVDMTDGTAVEYEYNAAGKRLIKRILDATDNIIDRSQYLRDESGAVIAELNNDNKLKYRMIFGSGGEILGRHLYYYDGNGDLVDERDTYYLKDHLGNNRITIADNSSNRSVFLLDGQLEITNEAVIEATMDINSDQTTLNTLETLLGQTSEVDIITTADYYPYGMVMRETINAPATDETAKYKYQGKERDLETGYDYFEARLYDSALGRFLQVDPRGDELHFQNSYTGMNNNPINTVDPDGKFGWGAALRALRIGYKVIRAASKGADIVNAIRGEANSISHDFNTILHSDRAAEIGKALLDLAVGTDLNEDPEAIQENSDETEEVNAPAEQEQKKETKKERKERVKQEAKARKENERAPDKLVKDKGKQLEKNKGKDAKRDAHDKKQKGEPDRSRKQIEEDYNIE